jgi:hypothetical protein
MAEGVRNARQVQGGIREARVGRLTGTKKARREEGRSVQMEARRAEIQGYKTLATMGEEGRAEKAGATHQEETQAECSSIEEIEVNEVGRTQEPSHTYHSSKIYVASIVILLFPGVPSKIDLSITDMSGRLANKVPKPTCIYHLALIIPCSVVFAGRDHHRSWIVSYPQWRARYPLTDVN